MLLLLMMMMLLLGAAAAAKKGTAAHAKKQLCLLCLLWHLSWHWLLPHHTQRPRFSARECVPPPHLDGLHAVALALGALQAQHDLLGRLGLGVGKTGRKRPATQVGILRGHTQVSRLAPSAPP